MLILSAIHIPLPQADYHNIRHHDAPGEICPFHDHLLRWHPAATSDADVALFHWHWFVPLVQPGAGCAPVLHVDLGELPTPAEGGGQNALEDGFLDHRAVLSGRTLKREQARSARSRMVLLSYGRGAATGFGRHHRAGRG